MKVVKIKPHLTFIDSLTARQAANEIEAIEEGADLHFVLKTFGGDLYDGCETSLALQNFKGHRLIDVPGIAASYGIVLLAFGDKNICSSNAKFMIHCPAGGSAKPLKEHMEEFYQTVSSRIDEDAFLKVTGKTLKSILIPEDGNRVDCWLNAKEANEVKLIDEVYKLDPKHKVAAEDDEVAGYYKFVEYKDNVPRGTLDKLNLKKMNKEKLKAEYPELYSEIVSEGKELHEQNGAKAEAVRTEALMEFHSIDPETVSAKLKDGSSVDAAFLLKMSAKVKENSVKASLEGGEIEGLAVGKLGDDKNPKAVVDLSVIPQDVRVEAERKMEDLEFSKEEVKAELEIIAKQYKTN